VVGRQWAAGSSKDIFERPKHQTGPPSGKGSVLRVKFMENKPNGYAGNASNFSKKDPIGTEPIFSSAGQYPTLHAKKAKTWCRKGVTPVYDRATKGSGASVVWGKVVRNCQQPGVKRISLLEAREGRHG